ncbi:MAG: hypothetical protein ACO1OX_03065 [Novosphingobium sp.]
MRKPADPMQILRKKPAVLEGLRKHVLSMVAMSAFLLATVMPIAAVYELWRVQEVSAWPAVLVRLDAVEKERPTFGKGPSVWRYRFTDPESGRQYQTGDVEPGDFPFTVMGWSTKDATAANYQARIGTLIPVRRSIDRSRYFLQAGDSTTMSVVLGLSGLYWVWLWLVCRRRKSEHLP